jgi:DNA mismatch endonuclease, patch repair protein
MRVRSQTASFRGLLPSSSRASSVARTASKKARTKCEVLLQASIRAKGLRFRSNVRSLPGQPDIVFSKAKLAVFCDGDFWHGKNWPSRSNRLQRGANAKYWLAKIRGNIQRDRRNTRELQIRGWTVLRFWESEIVADPAVVASAIVRALRSSVDTELG